MAYTLADSKQLVQDKLVARVIDEFRKSPLLDLMVFNDCVTPQGTSLTYSYNRVTVQPTASGRAINSEYTPQNTITKRISNDLKALGGSFEIDRVIAKFQKQAINLVDTQAMQKVKATRALATQWFFTGDEAQDGTSFDGLDKIVTGSSTEVDAASIDLSTVELIKANYVGLIKFVNDVIAKMDGEPTIIGVNNELFAVYQTIAFLAAQFTETKMALGTKAVQYGNALIIDAGDKPGTAEPIIPTDATKGTTDMYFARLAEDGVHMVTPDGMTEPEVILPKLNKDEADAKAVKLGSVELVTTTVVENSRSAGVLRNIKIKPAVTPPAGG